MAAGGLAGQTSLPSPDGIGLPRYPQADNDEYLLFSVRAAEESWFSSRFKLPEHRGPQSSDRMSGTRLPGSNP